MEIWSLNYVKKCEELHLSFLTEHRQSKITKIIILE